MLGPQGTSIYLPLLANLSVPFVTQLGPPIRRRTLVCVRSCSGSPDSPPCTAPSRSRSFCRSIALLFRPSTKYPSVNFKYSLARHYGMTGPVVYYRGLVGRET